VPAPLRALYVAIEKVAATVTHRFIAVGEEVRESYVEARVVAPGQCAVIYSGMDLGRFQRAGSLGEEEVRALRGESGIPADAVVIGSASRLEERKGHRYLIDAVAELARSFPQVHLLVAGDGPLREALDEQTRRAGMSGRVHFLGHRPDAERVIAMIDIFALTSTNEGLPRVLVQAAAMGKPIVAFAAPGVREVVVHGQNGYVVKIGDVGGLVAHLQQMLEDLPAARAMGRRGPALVDERWSVSRMVDSLSEVYDDLLEAA
jgi:glycosyltransferase involved in cell wall biosynthesis